VSRELLSCHAEPLASLRMNSAKHLHALPDRPFAAAQSDTRTLSC
jgi:hypothetical protein